MKYILAIFALIVCLNTLASQHEIQIVKIKHEDKSVSVYAVNNSEITYNVKINILMDGMVSEKQIPSEVSILPGQDLAIALLVPTTDKSSYKINFQATPVETRHKQYVDEEVPDVTIYTKNEQAKSTELRLYLKKHDIPYIEINASYDKRSKKIYENMLNRRSVNLKEAKLPVVIIRGEVFYNIKDMTKFLKEHLE